MSNLVLPTLVDNVSTFSLNSSPYLLTSASSFPVDIKFDDNDETLDDRVEIFVFVN